MNILVEKVIVGVAAEDTSIWCHVRSFLLLFFINILKNQAFFESVDGCASVFLKSWLHPPTCRLRVFLHTCWSPFEVYFKSKKNKCESG